MLADISYKSCVWPDVIRDDVDRISRKERKPFVSIGFPLPELVDLLYPLGILPLRSSFRKALRKVPDVAADTEIYGHILAYLGTVAVDMDLSC